MNTCGVGGGGAGLNSISAIPGIRLNPAWRQVSTNLCWEATKMPWAQKVTPGTSENLTTVSKLADKLLARTNQTSKQQSKTLQIHTKIEKPKASQAFSCSEENP